MVNSATFAATLALLIIGLFLIAASQDLPPGRMRNLVVFVGFIHVLPFLSNLWTLAVLG